MRKFFHITEYILAALALLIAGTIYPLFRGGDYLFTMFLDSIGWGEFYAQFYHIINATNIPNFVLFTLPDGLWAIAYILIIDALWFRYSLWERILIAGIIPATGILSEILQLTHILTGTFDILDVCIYAIPYMLYSLVILIHKKNELENLGDINIINKNK